MSQENEAFAEREFQRIREKIGEVPSATDPHISNALDMLRDGMVSTEEALICLVQILHTRAVEAEDALLILKLKRTG